MKENYEHMLYKHCDEKEADAVAWAFVNKEKMVKFPFKFPPIAPNEVRAKHFICRIMSLRRNDST